MLVDKKGKPLSRVKQIAFQLPVEPDLNPLGIVETMDGFDIFEMPPVDQINMTDNGVRLEDYLTRTPKKVLPTTPTSKNCAMTWYRMAKDRKKAQGKPRKSLLSMIAPCLAVCTRLCPVSRPCLKRQ